MTFLVYIIHLRHHCLLDCYWNEVHYEVYLCDSIAWVKTSQIYTLFYK